MVERFDQEGLHQLQMTSFVADEDLCGQNILPFLATRSAQSTSKENNVIWLPISLESIVYLNSFINAVILYIFQDSSIILNFLTNTV